MNEQEQKIYDSFYKHLSRFSLYQKTNWNIDVSKEEDGKFYLLHIAEDDSPVYSLGLIIDGKIAEIWGLALNENFRRRGYGRELSNIIDKFLEEIGVEIVTIDNRFGKITAEGKLFWPKMGFVDLK